MPHVDPPPIVKRAILKPDSSQLPQGAHGHLPARDGDAFFVTLPVKVQPSVSSREVRDAVVTPILKAIQFSRGTDALSLPPDSGVPQESARFSSFVPLIINEYANHPKQAGPETQLMLDTFAGKADAKTREIVSDAIQIGEGMSLSQFIAGIERRQIAYVFQQLHGGVPIEHTLLYAGRWQEWNITTVFGSLLNNYAIGNKVALKADAAFRIAVDKLAGIEGITAVRAKTLQDLEDGPYLVLLPYGNAGSGVQLRYAYRMILRADAFHETGSFILWADAQDGSLLELDPLLAETLAAGAAYNRDPGVGTSTSWLFNVNAASGGQYTLARSGVINRVDYQGDGYNSDDVSISDSSGGSSSSFANFNQAPINDAAQALCDAGTNKGFQQVDFFSVIDRYYSGVIANGIFTPFPTSAWSPKVQSASAGCNAWSNMDYGACQGYFDAACPNFSTGTQSFDNFMNFAHDNTIIGHELGHNITQRLCQARPGNWCGTPPCSIPVGWSNFHDLADFWADQFENTNCTAGWVSKNQFGVDASLNCAMHVENGLLPRLHSVTAPFNPATPGDHFPEHRAGGNTCDYCDMQMGAAALWQIRIGMRSKCRPSGMPQFAVRFQRALKQTGFFTVAPNTSDTGDYQKLYDLEAKMADQWATSGSPMGPPAFAHNGPHTTNKVTAGFARAGTFLVPYQCIDGSAATTDGLSCPTGENGADAVVDIDDNDTSNDLTLAGVPHPTWDFLKLGGVPATFHVWTGVRFKLDGALGSSTLTNPSPCNSQFQVEVSTDPAFPVASTITSPWTVVDTDPTTPASPECYGTWTPDAASWLGLQAGGDETRIYYRARTRDAAMGNDRLSTTPGNGLWSVPPPYAVFTITGASDY